MTRLERLRRVIRNRLVVGGVCAVLGGGTIALLAIVIADWLLWLPAALRIIIGLAFLAGLVTAVLRGIVRPLRCGLDVSDIAAHLERRFRKLDDRLVNAIDFFRHSRIAGSSEEPGTQRGESAAMMDRVIADADRIVRQIPLEKALSRRALVRWSLLMLVGAVALTVAFGGSPDWIRTGLYRYLYPTGALEWPRRVSIVSMPGSEKVALGESATVRMTIERGLRPSLRAVVHVSDSSGEVMTLPMQRGEDGLFSAMIDTVTCDLEYWFEAGDDDTANYPGTITAVRRPVVLEAQVEIEPPPYGDRRAIRTCDLLEGAVEAPQGGFATVLVKASKPIPRRQPAAAGLRLDNGDLTPLIVDPQEQQRLSARFEIVADLCFRVELCDEDGFANRGAVRHCIQARPDAPPVVSVLEPTSLTELTPRGAISLRARVADDFGLTRVTLKAERIGDGSIWSIPVGGWEMTADTEGGLEAAVEYLWLMEPMGLSPGDALTFHVEAEDNRVGEGTYGQVGRSAPLQVRVISEIEFELRVGDEMASLEDRLRRITLDETDLLDRTTLLIADGTAPVAQGISTRELIAELAAQQARLLRQVGDLAGRLDHLAQRMAQNGVGDEQARGRLTSVGLSLRGIGTGAMARAGTTLLEAATQRETREEQSYLRNAATAETEAVDGLRALLQGMAKWGEFQGIATRTRDLLDRQEAVRRRTAELGKRLLGRPLDELDKEETTALTRLQREQEQVGRDSEQLLARMTRLVDMLRERDVDGAQAIDDARRVAQARSLPRRVRAAAEAIRANRTAAATLDQKNAVATIREMVAALEERRSRELARLEKTLRGAEEQLTLLIDEQRSVQTATEEAKALGSEGEALELIADDQSRLRKNTGALGDKLDKLDRMFEEGRIVRSAAGAMKRAEDQINTGQTEAATVAQSEAIAQLDDARRRLEEFAQEVGEEAWRRSLGRVRESLEALLAGQREVNDGIGDLHTTISSKGRMGRAESRAASRLASRQSDVRRLLDEGLPDLQSVPVYEWALERVARWMDESRRHLETRVIDEALIATTTRIVRELEKLVDAIVETEAMPMDEKYADGAGGGGGRGQTKATKPVPPVAELLVLRAMQRDINSRTKSLAQTFDEKNATEEQLREIRLLGEDQAEVSRLTDRVTKKGG